MKSSIRSLAVYVCALGVLLPASAAQRAPAYKELPRFHAVNQNLFRGAQPLNGGMQRLSALGIRSVINLRGAGDDARGEEAAARAAGLRYFNIPLAGLSAPSDEQVGCVLTLIEDPDNQPVFIHCKRGSDRTGTIVAVYRISHDGWTAEQAIAEAKQHGMSWMEFGMKSYISDYYKRRNRPGKSLQAPAAAPTRSLHQPVSISAKLDFDTNLMEPLS